MTAGRLVSTARGVVTVARRRGVGYFGHLLSSVAWPQAAYRFAWGPTAPPILQGLFAAAGELAASKNDRAELERLKLVGPPGIGVQAGDAGPDEIEHLMNRAHTAGITGVASSFRALVRLPDGSLVFGDLTEARKHQPGSVYFVASRDRDRQAFNRSFGRSVLTEVSVRESLRQMKAQLPQTYPTYPPVDFGAGLPAGAGTDSTPSRWGGFSRQVVAPLVAGKRVLDLGSNNGALPLLLLRDGAREVVSVEFTPGSAGLARLNARILSWRDVRPYDIQVLTGDIRLFVTEDLGAFDVITAFCPLYYLPDAEMARIIHKAASMGAVLMLQANDAIDSLPAKALDLHRLMRDNGYPEVQVHTPAGLAQPVLVGLPHSAAIRKDIATEARTL